MGSNSQNLHEVKYKICLPERFSKNRRVWVKDDGDRKIARLAVVRIVQIGCVIVPDPIDGMVTRLHEQPVDIIQKTLQRKCNKFSKFIASLFLAVF